MKKKKPSPSSLEIAPSERGGGSMIHVGADKETIREAKTAILEIMRITVDPSVAVQALKTLQTICRTEVGSVSISDCDFRGAV